MFYRSGVLALVVSGVISVATTLIVLILDSISANAVVLLFLSAFVTCFGVIFFALQLLIVKPLNDIRKSMEGLSDKKVGQEEPLLASLKKVSLEMEQFATQKRGEIDQLKKQEAFRKDFIADISHELKTPIFAAQGFVHTLLDGAVKDKSVRKKFLRKAAKSLDGLDVLVQDLLTLSQIETGRITMQREAFDIYALTLDVFDQFRGKSNKKDIDLRIDGAVRKVLVYADSQRISQVMSNLISNAIKHSSAESAVVVSFSSRRKSVIIRVTDFGTGIPAEHLNRIFERFYRVDKSRSRERGGTGLGLAIVKHILEGHNTMAKVESEVGKGSTFSFKLPRAGVEKHENGEDQRSAEK